MGRDLVTEGADASAGPYFLSEHGLPQSRCVRCRRCAQDATSTRDTRTVLSSAVLGVCFCWHPVCVKAFARCTEETDQWSSEASYGGANGKIKESASQFAFRADPLFVRVVSRLLCTHIVLRVEHGKMF